MDSLGLIQLLVMDAVGVEVVINEGIVCVKNICGDEHRVVAKDGCAIFDGRLVVHRVTGMLDNIDVCCW